MSFYEIVVMFVDLKWRPYAAAKTRTSIADALAMVTPLLVSSMRGRPDDDVLRAALYGWAFHKARRDVRPLKEPESARDRLDRESLTDGDRAGRARPAVAADPWR